MRVAQLVGVRQFRLVEGQTPDPGPGEVQVQVKAVGVCGSDMHAYAEGALGDTPAPQPPSSHRFSAITAATACAGATTYARRCAFSAHRAASQGFCVIA
jgi:L-iditol 2-dehydrogenase